MKKITKQQIIELAIQFNIEPRALDAVIQVECSGSGFESTGDLKIQFEPHYFKRFTGKVIENGVSGPKKEWDAYNKAKAIDWEAALKSTSWGMGQIMGSNYKLAGYDSVADMINDFKTGEVAQVKGMLNFIVNTKLLKHIQSKNWALFAKGYNGPSYLKFKYDTRLQEAYLKSKI